jgi:hypothetical protein
MVDGHAGVIINHRVNLGKLEILTMLLKSKTKDWTRSVKDCISQTKTRVKVFNINDQQMAIEIEV